MKYRFICFMFGGWLSLVCLRTLDGTPESVAKIALSAFAGGGSALFFFSAGREYARRPEAQSHD